MITVNNVHTENLVIYNLHPQVARIKYTKILFTGCYKKRVQWFSNSVLTCTALKHPEIHTAASTNWSTTYLPQQCCKHGRQGFWHRHNNKGWNKQMTHLRKINKIQGDRQKQRNVKHGPAQYQPSYTQKYITWGCLDIWLAGNQVNQSADSILPEQMQPEASSPVRR